MKKNVCYLLAPPKLQDDLGTVKEADYLASLSLLQKAQGGNYIFHDSMLAFVRMECDCKELEPLVEGGVKRQRQYLGRLAVFGRYHSVGEQGLYAIMHLWRSLEELSGTDRMVTETYAASLDEIAEIQTESAALAHSAVARFFEMAVSLAVMRPKALCVLLASRRGFMHCFHSKRTHFEVSHVTKGSVCVLHSQPRPPSGQVGIRKSFSCTTLLLRSFTHSIGQAF